VASPQFNGIVASLRERLAQIDAELAMFETLQSERGRVAAAIEALQSGGSSDRAATIMPSPRRSQGGKARRSRARRAMSGAAFAHDVRLMSEHDELIAEAVRRAPAHMAAVPPRGRRAARR
jgi:hypothetical protein